MITDLNRALQPGKKIRVWYTKDNPNNRLLHIRAVVDEDWIVFKEWWYSKKRWHYEVKHKYYFEIRNRDNNLLEVI